MKKREFSFPTILGILITIAGLATGVFLLRRPILSLVGASPEEAPVQVKITNLSDIEFVVTWTTSKATSGYIQYGEGENPNLIVSDDRDQENGNVGNYFTHFVTVKGLKPDSIYSFRIGSGRSLYDQQGQLYQVTTGPSLKDPPAADVSYGQVATADGDPAEGAIVYLNLPGIIPQAALVKASGSWVIPLSTSRTTDLTSFAPYDPALDKIEIFVQAGELGTAQVITTTQDDSPVPAIVLGSMQDLSQSESITPAPTAIETINFESKFSTTALSPSTEATGAGNLTILTPKFSEEVNTTQPEILGRAPAGATVTIEIHSETVVQGSVVADPDGNWSYSVPQDLEPGEHTITITTLVNGIAQQVTRTFVVQAAESSSPAFSATPSATLATTPTSSPTLQPTLIPRTVIPSTESGVPQSGNLTPTLIVSILGIGLISVGLFVGRKQFI